MAQAERHTVDIVHGCGPAKGRYNPLMLESLAIGVFLSLDAGGQSGMAVTPDREAVVRRFVETGRDR
jgi:hypothetical protein